ncbi:MAG: 2-dehydropantoate 2-reductase [Oscillospiraceae bacterium]|nr:2-dehydropantoate 2-reductase [Oscillospiraceae bacterium]
MKIAMVGCGAAGSCFAGYLRKGGADITLVDMYKAHMDKIAAEGLEFIIYPDTHYHLDGFKTAYNAENIGTMDIVIFVTKATQLDAAVESAKPCIGPDTVVLSLINGLGNDDVLLKHFPANRILCGSGALGTALKEPGCCISTEVEGTLVHFGALENGPVTDKAGRHLAELFNAGGCRAEFNEDDRPNIWKKVIINCTVNTVCALLRLKIIEVAEDPYGMELFRDVVREACAIATARGVPYDAVEFENTHLKNFIDNMGDYYPSMAQDMLQNHRQTEIDNLNGKLCEYGRQLGIPTPLNDVLVTEVKAIQANYDKQYLK